MDLDDHMDAVVDEPTFLAFVRALAEDRRADVVAAKAHPPSPHARSARGWENKTIEDFLDGAIGWAEDTDFGKSQGLAEANPWKRFAEFLYCGKIYE